MRTCGKGMCLEVYAEGPNGPAPVRHRMTRKERVAGSTNQFLYVGAIPASRPSGAFTPRIIPLDAGASVPLEAPFILWYGRP